MHLRCNVGKGLAMHGCKLMVQWQYEVYCTVLYSLLVPIHYNLPFLESIEVVLCL